jgi:flagellar biosynthesis protein FliR
LPVSLAADEVFGILLLLARIGSALMLLPGFGEPYVLVRFRLLLALLLSLALAAPLGESLPAMPQEPAMLARLVAGEVVLGLFIGASARALFAALHIAGAAIAYQSGLAAAAIFDPNEATQGTLPGNLLTTLALVLLFASDGHHLLLRALAASYEGLPAGAMPPLDDMAELLVRLIDQAFAVAVRIAAPLIALSMLMYLGMGVLNRLMPAFQVFFIALPLQMLLAFAMLMLGLGTGLLVFFRFFASGAGLLALGG